MQNAIDLENREEDVEDEVEPKLKYRRISNDLAAILKKDAASCMAVNSKFIALGSHWGVISIMDHLGNNIKSKELVAHTTTVNQISIDENGDFIGSCSDDGRVIIHGLYSSDYNMNISFDCPVKAIALDPEYYKSGSGRRFIVGENKLILHEKTFMSRVKTTVLHEGDGMIRNIQWVKQFVAWASEFGVRIYDMNARRTISAIKREHNPNLRSELYRCNLRWKNDRCLLIGWADVVKVCEVKEKPRLDAGSKDLPYFYVEITRMFTTDFFICGIAPYGNNLVILSYSRDDAPENNRPQLRIVEPFQDSFEEICTDVLSLRGFSEYRCNDYHLDCLAGEGSFFIVSPKDVVIAEPTTVEDHIIWLMDHSKFEEAMMAVREAGASNPSTPTLLQVGWAYLDHLLNLQKPDEAARLCVEVIGRDKSLWEEAVYKFARIHRLSALSPYLPRSNPRLEPVVYEMVLNEFLLTDYEGFRKLIREWPSELYSIPTVINAVIDRVVYEPSATVLLHCLSDLYTYQRKYDMALAIYLKLGHKDVFDLIHNHKLYSTVLDKLDLLMQVDTDRAIKLFLDNMDKIPVDTVVKRLEKRPDLLVQYLDRLFVKDSNIGEEYHGLQVKLYAQYQPEKLLSFLRNSNYYPLQAALEVCQMHHLTPEMVFLLGRMGNTKQALQLITSVLQDIDRAIEFCKEHDDKDLWEDLIVYSLKNPEFVNALLQNIGTHVDTIVIIKRIEKDMIIPGLRDSLVKILQDHTLQVSLREDCKKILVSDCFNLLEKLNKQQRRGVS